VSEVDDLRHLEPQHIRTPLAVGLVLTATASAVLLIAGASAEEWRWLCCGPAYALMMIGAVIWAEVRTDRRLAAILHVLGPRLDTLDKRLLDLEQSRYMDGWLDAATGRPPQDLDVGGS
jgi:hypothetical protein